MASLKELTSATKEVKECRGSLVDLLVQLEEYMPDLVDASLNEYIQRVDYLSQNSQKVTESTNPSHAQLKKDIQIELAFYNRLDSLYNGKLNQGLMNWDSFRQEVRMLNGSCNNGTILQDTGNRGPGGAQPKPNQSAVRTPVPTQQPIGGGGQADNDDMEEIMRAIAEADAAEARLKEGVRIDVDAMQARRDMRGLAGRDQQAEQARANLATGIAIDSRLRSEYQEADSRRVRDEAEQAERDLRDRFGRTATEEARLRDFAYRDAQAERDADYLREKVRRDAEAERAVQEMRGIASIGSKYQQEQDRLERDKAERERKRREEEEGEKAIQALRSKIDADNKARKERERRDYEDAEGEKEARKLREMMKEDARRNKVAEDEARKMREFAALDPKKQRAMEKQTRSEREADGLVGMMRELAAGQKRGNEIAQKQNLGYEYSDEDEPTGKRYNAKAASDVIGGSLSTMLNQGAFADLLSKGLGGGLLNKDNQDAYSMSEKQKLEQELKNVTSQLESMKSVINDEEQRYLTLKDKLHSMRTLGNELETDIENIRQEKEEEDQATKDLEKEIADLEKDLQSLDKDYREIEKNDEHRLDVHKEVRKERMKHKEVLQKLELEIEEYKSSYDSLMKKWQTELNGEPAVASAPVVGNYFGSSLRNRLANPFEKESHHLTTFGLGTSDRLAAIRNQTSGLGTLNAHVQTSSYHHLDLGVASSPAFPQYTSSRVQNLPVSSYQPITIRSVSREPVSLHSSLQTDFYQGSVPATTSYRSGSLGPQAAFQTGSYADRYLSTLRK